MTLGVVLVLASVSLAASASFTVAEVKPHYGCQSPAGQERVRQYISNLTAAGTGIISLLEMEFALPQPSGYAAFGAACGKHFDPAVVLFDEAQFSMVSTIGATLAGNYSAVPYLGGAPQAVGKRAYSMCVSDPTARFGPDGIYPVGSRPYSGAVLKHLHSGRELCVLTGTFAHCSNNWTEQFVTDIEQGCGDRQLLIVADTNAGCVVPTLKSDSQEWSMNKILAKHGRLSWGPCHDPGQHSQPTCCNDTPDFPYPRYWYDRTAICRGGRVADFKVEAGFVCGDSRAEHLFTRATIELGELNDKASPYCLDHSQCASMGVLPNASFLGSQMLPVDGKCCPTSSGDANLPCCSS